MIMELWNCENEPLCNYGIETAISHFHNFTFSHFHNFTISATLRLCVINKKESK